MDGPTVADGEGGTGDTRPVESGVVSSHDAPVEPMQIVRDLLDATRTDGDVDPHLTVLARASPTALGPLHEDRALALAFFTNLYNAGTQVLLARRPALYEGPLRTVRFFRAPCVTVAGTPLSLNDIEHGVLRGSKSSLGLGYLPRLRPGTFERRYRVETVDPRIHFALNCGAASCPAIRAYEPDRIDDQLDLATRSYLEATVEYDPATDVVTVPRVFLWYRGDFGGGAGVREFLAGHGAIPEGTDPRLRYRSWDWRPVPRKFA
jgi:hypothetical protein